MQSIYHRLQIFINSFVNSRLGEAQKLSTYGAGMSYSDARSYAQTHGLQRQIIFVDPSRISYYQSNGYSSVGSAGHAIVVSSAIRNSNGDTTGYNVYDPQNYLSFTIGLSESGQNNGTHWVY